MVAALAALLPAAPALAETAASAPPPPPSDARLAAEPARHDLTREQFYFLLPDRFANGDRANDLGGLAGSRLSTGYDPTDKGFYQGGDLRGITERLDYIKGLGTTAIWLAPVFKNQPVQGTGADASAGYHGYWITDFTQVDPHFGSNAELTRLIDKAHAKGMKVFFDVITNHTADVIDHRDPGGGKTTDYLAKGAFPYLGRDGVPFDDGDHAQPGSGSRPFPRTGPGAFPRIPVVPPGREHAKVPDWLNDPAMYHNRGDSTFAGESATQGDFAGLDDLWTERPEVVAGMERVYQRWVKDFAVDGFRIDTVKHVNTEFWTQWATALDAYAAKRGRPDFFMFGEVYSADPAVTAPYVTRGRLDATLDFPFQDAARSYASRGGPPGKLAGLFAQDHRYTTDKANAYESVTFLGNHDMGRFGAFLRQDNPGADEAELLRRYRLANELMFLGRGNPVVYYGDEQGFTGAGGDKDARQTLFASKTADYLDDDQLGTDRTHASDAYDPGHPLYRSIAALSRLTRTHPALRDGVQTERYADPGDGPGVYAFSRTGLSGTDAHREYLVAVNNAAGPRTVRIPVATPDTGFRVLYGAEPPAPAVSRTGSAAPAVSRTGVPGAGAGPRAGAVVRAGGRELTVTVPALASLVLRADRPVPVPAAGPAVRLTAPPAGVSGSAEVTARVDGDGLTRVVFAAQAGDGPWRTLGSADHAPYQVTQHLPAALPGGTPLRYKAVAVDAAGRTASALAATTAGPPPPKPGPPGAVDREYAVVHYRRPAGDYDGWGLRTGTGTGGTGTAGTTAAFTGRDAYGAFAWVRVPDGATTLTYTVERGGAPGGAGATDGPARTVDLAATGRVWIAQGDPGQRNTAPEGAYPPQPAGTAVIHYHRSDGRYDGWGLHTWTGAATPTDWARPLEPVRVDAYGAVFEVPLAPGATSLSHIVHRGDEKDVPADRSLDFGTHGREIWLLTGETAPLLPTGPAASAPDLGKAEAQWIDATTVVWKARPAGAASRQLMYAPHGGISAADPTAGGTARWLRLLPATLSAAQRAAYPHLKDWPAYVIDPRDRSRVPEALRGQVVAAQHATTGALLAATGVQLPGVLDDLYGRKAAGARLGPVFHHGRPTLAVWAPTARTVALELGGKTRESVPMRRDAATGVWSVTGPPGWRDRPYRYAVTVWAPTAGRTVTNRVTDPYSTALTADSARSLVTDLADPRLAPKGWQGLRKPAAVPLRNARIQELHLRDFSAHDPTSRHPGGYLAFTDTASDGMRHLRGLAAAGTSYVHLLPVFDFGTVPERESGQSEPGCDLASLPPDAAAQQECVAATAAKDAFNWGYDPLHHTVPEGSYASDPDGTARTVEFRRMVRSLNGAGLRTVMDVVYNHTVASGQDERSVLDRIVPGYYQRLLDDGAVATSTCCANTAPEHTMMGKLVVDSVVTWAREYKVDGFRFDLMGHHPKANILAVREALDALTPARDGVDGKRIILYGEGWNFGEVANDARFVQATQKNMAGTGVATFSDRARDAVRGGGPFDTDPRVQGFASGLFTDPNGSPANGTPAEQRARLLHYQDLVKVGLTGNLADYPFTDTLGRAVTGAGVDYNGAPAGYAAAPGDALAYADAHDNETLYDALAFKLPAATRPADRARAQVVALATAVLSQGPALSQAGSELLRSKSLDRNSYDSGDWFNTPHWDCRAGNGFGRGLPPAADNRDKWPYAKPLLADPALRMGCPEITAASAAYRDLLTIRATEPAFGLATTEQVREALSFPLSGPEETPGVITMRLGDLVVVFNATPGTRTQTVPALSGTAYRPHPVQARGADPVTRTAAYDRGSGTFTVPARTVAVFTRR
ncbi:pullulanase-type alpha-1,6-glucosidase [Streptomyces sp. LP05-1]|uniref:1,4-alpha-D-glucan glucanohydrolase n=1 Tax=Streptomyces pyxinae TaxID=2970734 RepID=A0ABT2CFS0_9ACTN|nr:pullulanase-type alpha-1,6-glucosidase [Streptomyces sp. LP05-1]MCS0636266.1 pullulanase-type alpha-1,6-glucosidase [Streptomyces sp. LP05-1]